MGKAPKHKNVSALASKEKKAKAADADDFLTELNQLNGNGKAAAKGRNQGRSSTGAVAHSAVSPPGDPAYAVLASGPFAGIPVQASAAGSVAASAYASRLTGASVRSSFNGAPADSGTELPTLWAGMGSAQPAASAAWWPQSSADWVRTEQFSAGPAAAAASFGAAGPLPTAAPAWGSGGPARAAEPAQHLPGAAGALSAGAHSNGGLLEHGGVEGLTGSLGRIAQSASAAASAARGAAAGMRQAAGTGMVDGQGSVAQPPGALPAQERPADAAVEWSAAQGLMPQAAGTQSAEAHGPVPQPANPLPAPERRAAAAVGRPPAPQGPAVQPAAGQPAAAAQAAEAQAAPAGQPCKAQPAALHAAMAQPAPLRPADTQLPDSMGQPAALQGAGAQRAPAPPAVAQPAAVQAAAACATEAQPAVPLPGLPQPAALAPLIEAGPAAAAAPPAAAAAARSAAQPATQSIIEDAPQAVAEPLAASALPAAAVAAPSASPALAAAPVGGMQHAASSNMGSGEAEPEAVIGADTSAPVMETAAGPMARMQYGGSTDMGSGEAEIEAEVDAVTSALGRAAAGRSSGAGLAAAPSFDAWDPAWRGGAGGAAADKNGAPWREPRASREDPYSYLGAAQGGGWPYAQEPSDMGLVAGLKGFAAPLLEVAVRATCSTIALVQPSWPQAARVRKAIARRVHTLQVRCQDAWGLPMHLVAFTELIMPRGMRKVISMFVEAVAAMAALLSYLILLTGL